MEQYKKYSQIAIERDEKEFFSVLDALPYGILLIQENKHIYFANALAQEMAGKYDLAGTLCHESFCAEESCTYYSMDKGALDISKKDLKRQDGSVIPILKTSQPIVLNNEHYYLEVFVDTSLQSDYEKELWEKTIELKEIIRQKETAEKKALEESDKFEQLFEEVPDALFLHDWNGNILKVNQKACLLLGYTKQELETMNVMDIDKQASMQDLEAIVTALKKNEKASFETIHLTKSGKEVPVEVKAKVLDYDNKKVILGSTRNMTERIEHEKELIEARHKAQESERLKTAFLNNISHEIRTPLNGIVGFLDFLDDDNLEPEEKSEFKNIIRKSSERLIETVTSIIEISKLDSAVENIEKETFSVKDIMSQFVSKIKSKYIKPHVEFTYELDAELQDVLVETDKSKLTQILKYLLDNAYKFTNSGQINFKIERRKNELVCSVEDTGVGIGKDHLEVIFESFRQADLSNTREFDGNGLGLTLAKKLTEALGGSICVESAIGEGSTFTVKVPDAVKKEESLPSADLAIENKVVAATRNGKNKVLIAEDEEANFMYMAALLRKQGYEVSRAFDGEEAVKECMNGNRPDLVIMDLKMPGMNGFNATREIRKIQKGLPIIVSSAFVMDDEKQKSFEAGCSGFISKPTRRQDLLGMIEKHLDISE